MRVLFRLALPAAIVTAAALAAWPAAGQAPSQPPPVAPAKPYNPVAIKLPEPLKDPGFEAFRRQLGEIANKRDRAALARLVVAKDFFWATESGDKAVKTRPGIDNLAAALQLNAKDNSGWFMLAGLAQDPTAAPITDRKEVVCSPVDPAFDERALEDIAKATQTDPGEWGYPVLNGLEVRSGPQPNAPVVDKLGLHLIRVMPDDVPPAGPQSASQPPPLRIVTPAGKIGYVPIDAVSPIGGDQICYLKEANGGWKIVGFIGVEP